MKKLLAIVLVLTLVLSMGITAFAVVIPAYEDWSPVTINKEIKLTNEGTINPAETFNFTVGAGSGLRDGVAITAPDFDPDNDPNEFSIDIAQGVLLGSEDIALPTFSQVGVYTYPITEISGDTAGMIYDNGPYDLVVTVINNPDFGEEDQPPFLRVLTVTRTVMVDNEEVKIKVETFENEFSAGDLKIDKVIAGNYSDPNDEFEITVTITPPEDLVINAGPIVWNTATENVSGPDIDGKYTAVYTLKGGENVTIENLPYGVTYEVEETDSGEYDPTYDGNEEGVLEEELVETIITNTRNTEINTGINLDNLPYILILVGAAVGLVAFTMKRRLSDDR